MAEGRSHERFLQASTVRGYGSKKPSSLHFYIVQTTYYSEVVGKAPFLAVYQTDRGDISSGTGGSEKVRLGSDLWKKEGVEGSLVFDVADLIMADGALVEVLGSYEHNESSSTFIDQSSIC